MILLGRPLASALAGNLAEPIELLLVAELASQLQAGTRQILSQGPRRDAELVGHGPGSPTLDARLDQRVLHGVGHSCQAPTDVAQLISCSLDLAQRRHAARVQGGHKGNGRSTATSSVPPGRIARRGPDPLHDIVGLIAAVELLEQVGQGVTRDALHVGAHADIDPHKASQRLQEALGHRRIPAAQQLDVEGDAAHALHRSAVASGRLAKGPRALSCIADLPDENTAPTGIGRNWDHPISVHFWMTGQRAGAGPAATQGREVLP